MSEQFEKTPANESMKMAGTTAAAKALEEVSLSAGRRIAKGALGLAEATVGTITFVGGASACPETLFSCGVAIAGTALASQGLDNIDAAISGKQRSH
jgi:hypothetical protein